MRGSAVLVSSILPLQPNQIPVRPLSAALYRDHQSAGDLFGAALGYGDAVRDND